MTPEETSPTDMDRIEKPAARRKVQLVEQTEARPAPVTVPAPRHAVQKARPADRLLRVAERVVGDWAPTLREAFLRVLVFAVLVVCLGVALGGETAVLGAVVGFVMFLVGRRRAGSTL